MGICETKQSVRKKSEHPAGNYLKIDEGKHEDLNGTAITKSSDPIANLKPIRREFAFLRLNYPYDILPTQIDIGNNKIQLARDTNTQKEYVIKYVLGSRDYLKLASPRIEKYSKFRFAYLAPLLQSQTEEDQIILRMNYYENTLEKLVGEKQNRGDKLIILYRIARTILYLQKNGVRHNKLEMANIFISNQGDHIVNIGLPSWAESKQKEKSTTRIAHITAFSTIFEKVFPPEGNEEALTALKAKMKECARNQLTMDQIIQSIFSLNFCDDIQPVEDVRKTIIEYVEGDHYEGEVDQQKNKEGYGVMTELESKYWGNWANNLRSGRGNFQCNEYIYIGEWKNNEREGFGLEIMLKNREYYEGNFVKGNKTGFGIWQGAHGQVYIGNWKDNSKHGEGAYYDQTKFYYQGGWQNDMKHGKCKQLFFQDGVTYEGSYTNNLKHGKGHYIYPKKFEYIGEFVDNIITGNGTFIDKDGNEYIGALVNGEYEGFGQFTNKDKTYFYEGQWQGGARFGQGMEKTRNSVYTGSFVANIRDGKGTLKEMNETYNGEFRKGKVTGNGEYFYENGDVYKGYFLDKFKEGKGTYVSAIDGSIYQGNWRKDKKQGKGRHTLKKGEYYDGDWVDSKRQGFGILFSNQQNKYEGYWKNDKKEGKGIQFEFGNRYQGLFQNGMKHCEFGILNFTNGDRYEGSFVENRQEGQGKYIWVNGDEYIGGFVANNREGEGKMTYKSSSLSYQGGWKQDKREGHGIERYYDGYFQGKFINDLKDGAGVRTFIDAQGTCTLTGTWTKNMKHGEFDFQFANQEIEKREYSNDRQINLGMTYIPS